jgi:hypothetical protein
MRQLARRRSAGSRAPPFLPQCGVLQDPAVRRSSGGVCKKLSKKLSMKPDKQPDKQVRATVTYRNVA